VAKPKRRQQQHLRQESSRKKSYALGGTAPKEIYKPGFPMNLLGNIKFFGIVGIGATLVMVFAALATRGANSNAPVDVPTDTPIAGASADASASAVATATPNPKTFSKAESVIDAATKKYTATIKTDKGDIVLALDADKAPNTVNSFVFLAQQHYFDGIIIHRVAPNFVIQMGDPKGDGTGGPGYTTADEPNQVSNKRGTVAMAKTAGASEFGSQFFINLKDNTSLDYTSSANKFYPFATVTSGMDVVDAISKVPADSNEKPLQPITIQTVTVQESPK
jgi:cyclophilin family peptidyl-prolyl cis-trans isomerase